MSVRERVSLVKKENDERKIQFQQNKFPKAVTDLMACEHPESPFITTPFSPRSNEHSALLLKAKTGQQQTNFILHLQRTYGNRYVQSLMESIDMQPKAASKHPDNASEDTAGPQRASDMSVNLEVLSLQGRKIDSNDAAKAKAALQQRITEGFRDPDPGNCWGFTDTEQVKADIIPKKNPDENTWSPEVKSLTGLGSLRAFLVDGCDEVTGPGGGGPGQTTADNWREQVAELKNIADSNKETEGRWYMVKAVKAHEEVHWKGMKKALDKKSDAMAAIIENVQVDHQDGMTKTEAMEEIEASDDYTAACEEARDLWDDEYVKEIDYDHAGLTPEAEHRVVDPMIRKIEQVFKERE